MLESIPCLFITILSGFRVAKIHKAQQNYQNSHSRSRAMSTETSTPAAHRSTVYNKDALKNDSDGRAIPLSPLLPCPSTAKSSYSKTPSFSSPVAMTPPQSPSPRQFHLPFTSQEEKVQLSPDPVPSTTTPAVVHLTSLQTERSVPLLYAPLLDESAIGASKEGDKINQPQQSSLRWDRESLWFG